MTPEAILEFHGRYSFKILEIEDIPKNLSKSLKSANSRRTSKVGEKRISKRVLFLFSIKVKVLSLVSKQDFSFLRSMLQLFLDGKLWFLDFFRDISVPPYHLIFSLVKSFMMNAPLVDTKALIILMFAVISQVCHPPYLSRTLIFVMKELIPICMDEQPSWSLLSWCFYFVIHSHWSSSLSILITIGKKTNKAKDDTNRQQRRAK